MSDTSLHVLQRLFERLKLRAITFDSYIEILHSYTLCFLVDYTVLLTNTWQKDVTYLTQASHNVGLSWNSRHERNYTFVFLSPNLRYSNDVTLAVAVCIPFCFFLSLTHACLSLDTEVLRCRQTKLLLAWKSTTSASGSMLSCEMSSTLPVVRNPPPPQKKTPKFSVMPPQTQHS